MFMELDKFSRLVMHLNSCSMDLGRDTYFAKGALWVSNTLNRAAKAVADFGSHGTDGSKQID